MNDQDAKRLNREDMRRIAKYMHRALTRSTKMRSEQEIFDELASLCTLPGYIHAIAAVCFRDNIATFDDKLKADDISHWYSGARLIRTEIATLIGLMMRAPIDFSLPKPNVLSDCIEQTDVLMEELHQAIIISCQNVVLAKLSADPGSNPFESGTIIREPIFYSTESAYNFQYRDMAAHKYRKDTEWLLDNKGIDIEVCREVCLGVSGLINERLSETINGFRKMPSSDWTILPGFIFSCDELAVRIGRPEDSVRAAIKAFTMPEGESNSTFTSLHAFNTTYAYPFIHRGDDNFIILQPYGLSQAIYETPFYWMHNDKAYADSSLSHRGEFAESFAARRLVHVFGAEQVFQNVEIRKSKRQILGEIDVLVVFGGRAIVLQAKSKKLTLKAREGNDLQLRSDFKKAIQESVDQAFNCSELLNDSSVTLCCRDGRTVPLVELPRYIFLLSVVSDHYPALAFQAKQFLKINTNERISPPLVIDVFALDVITEMLDSPLRLLSYLDLRARFGEKLMANQELTLLTYHLKQNLWVDDHINLISLDDDISADIDVAMMVRREGIHGEMTPDGILTRFEGTHFAKIITEIEHNPDRAAIDLGLMLLEMGEDTVWEINGYIDQILTKTVSDGGLHDVTMNLSTISCGLTLHCSMLGDNEAATKLGSHCAIRKYSQKADKWFGVALRQDGSVHLVAELNNPWEFDKNMETILKKWTIRVDSA